MSFVKLWQLLARIGQTFANVRNCYEQYFLKLIIYHLFTAQIPDWRRHARSRPSARSRANPSQESRRARPGPRSATFRRPPASPPPQSRTSDGWAGLDETIVPCGEVKIEFSSRNSAEIYIQHSADFFEKFLDEIEKSSIHNCG